MCEPHGNNARRETPESSRSTFPSNQRRTIRGNHPVFSWSSANHVQADGRRRRGQPTLLSEQPAEVCWVPAFVRTSAARMRLIAKLNIWGCENKVRICQIESKKKTKQARAYRNACNSCLLWGRAGWPSGSTSLLLFSAPERRIKHSVIIVSTAPQNCSLQEHRSQLEGQNTFVYT